MYGDGVDEIAKLEALAFGVAEFAKAVTVKRLGVHKSICVLSVAAGVVALSVSESVPFSLTSLGGEVGGSTVNLAFGVLLALGDTIESCFAFGVTVAGVPAVGLGVLAVFALSVDSGAAPPFSRNWTLEWHGRKFASTQ